jgi:hypothetical protein
MQFEEPLFDAECSPPIEVDGGLFTFINDEIAYESSLSLAGRTQRSSGAHEDGTGDSEDDESASGDDAINVDNEQELEQRGFGDEEEVHIASDSHRWKIDLTKGEYRLAGMLLSSQAECKETD